MGLKDKISNSGSVVFSFYNVAKQDDKGIRDSAGLTVDPQDLKRNIVELMAAGHKAVSVSDVIDGSAPDGSFALMACDGYDLDTGKDGVIEFVRANAVPLSFSIPADLVGRNKPSWTNQIEIALQESLDARADDSVPVEFFVPGTQTRVSYATVSEAISVRNVLKDKKPADMDGQDFVSRICDAMSAALGEKIEPVLNSTSPFDRKMTWDQIKGLQAEGMTIISHGFSHTNSYVNLSNAVMRNDLTAAGNAFSAQIGVTPDILTYPEGQCDGRVMMLVQNAGITAAFTMEEGAIDQHTDRMKLPRVTVTQNMLDM